LFASIGTYLILTSRASTSIASDFNSDGKVDIYDLSILANNWGKSNATNANGDANNDMVVNVFDLSVLASQWNTTSSNPDPTPTPGPKYNVLSYGAKGDGITDDTLSIQNAVNAAGTSGGTVLFPSGTYLISNSIKLPANNSALLNLSGYGATIKQSSFNTSFLAWKSTSGIVVYRKFLIEGFNVDNQNLGSNQSNYAAFGIRGGKADDSYENITIKDCSVTNVPNTTLAHAYCFDIVVSGNGHATDIFILGSKAYGGVSGFAVWGYNPSPKTNPPTSWMDRIYIRNCYHDTGYLVSTFDVQENYHIGQGSSVGTVEITDCIGKNSGDVGIEVDNVQNLLIKNCTMYNPWDAGFYITNFYPPLGTDPGTGVLENNTTILDRSQNMRGFGFVIEPGEALGYQYTPLGTYTWRNGTFTVKAPYNSKNTHAAFDTWGSSCVVTGLIIDGYAITDPTNSSLSVLFNTSKLVGPRTLKNITINGVVLY
jgi:hypothetical protein